MQYQEVNKEPFAKKTEFKWILLFQFENVLTVVSN